MLLDPACIEVDVHVDLGYFGSIESTLDVLALTRLTWLDAKPSYQRLHTASDAAEHNGFYEFAIAVNFV